MRILGIDYGDKRTGFAVSDELGLIATPLKTYSMKSMKLAIDYAASLTEKLEVELIVLGLPLNMDGSRGFRAEKVTAFGRVLERVSKVPVRYQDERLTSVEAEEILKEGNVKADKRKELVDSMAARLILQDYLEAVRNKQN